MKNAIPGNWIFRTAPVLGLLFGLLLPGACFAALPPVITSQPTNQTIQCQCSVTFQVTVNSLSALTYQWHKDGAEIPGATSYTYTISNVQMSDEGSYSVNVTNAGGFAISSNAVLTVYTRTAPTLDASKVLMLAAEDEDAGSPIGPVGTLVSQLVDFASPAGELDNVADPDSNPLLGIAVTDADTSHGSWYYSTNDGSAWNALGAVSELTARLLASDSGTRIYFKPNLNWNGTLDNAITFRAWDQTTGSNGKTAVARASGTILDTFSTVSYSNNDGTCAWNGGWVDIDGLVANGAFVVLNPEGVLELTANNSTDWIYRDANLSGVSSAVLSFNYDSQFNDGDGGRADFQISTNNGTTYTTLRTFTETSYFGSGTFSTNITAFASTNTRIRFKITGKSSPTRRIDFDNVQITYTSTSIGGTTAFSLAKDSASLTVNPINDAPVANNQSVSTPGNAAKLITLTGSDIDNDPLTFSLSNAPTNGVLSNFNPANGTVTYTPNSGFAGPDSFTFRVNDGTIDGPAAAVAITITPVAPTISTQPKPLTVTTNQSAVFSVVATGTATLKYQWKRNNTTLTSATNSVLTLNNVKTTDAGNYTVVVMNGAGSVTSAAAALTVTTNLPPSPKLTAPDSAPGGFTFKFSVPTGRTYMILASSDFQNWTPIYTNLAVATNIVFVDPDAANFTMRFYRAKVW